MTSASDPRHAVTAARARLVSLACRAPSIANSQPWLWRTDGTSLELYADRSRQLPVDDPCGRQLMVSCGATLHHLEVAAAAMGWRPRVERVPIVSGDRPLVARVVLAESSADDPRPGPSGPPGPPGSSRDADQDVLAAIRARRTDRSRFTTWPVPADRIGPLTRAAARRGVGVLPVVDAVDKTHLSSLVLAAGEPRRGSRQPADAVGDLEPTDGALVLYGSQDEEHDWVSAGIGLSALWLEAARSGLGVVPLSVPVEDESIHRLLRQSILLDRGAPVLVLRVSWAPMGRGHLSGTTRRALRDVLEVVGPDGCPTAVGDQGPRHPGAAASPEEPCSTAQ